MNNFLNIHASLWAGYEARGFSSAINHSDKDNCFDEPWKYDHYFTVGRDALRIVMSELLANGRDVPASILDFACGSGRVTRHLRAMFPDARVGACDLDPSHIAFCQSKFGAEPFQSLENLADLDVGQWDLIFCGSLLAHLPHHRLIDALQFLARSLTPHGIAIATVEGRHTLHIQDHKWKLVSDDLFDIARAQYYETGFGFVDYNTGLRGAASSAQESYGVALINPSRLIGEIQSVADVRILGFRERAWDDHQDVIVFGRPGVNEDEWHEASLPCSSADPLPGPVQTLDWCDLDDAHLFFNESYYLQKYADVAAGSTGALDHYLIAGWHEGRQPHALFDVDHYRRQLQEGEWPLDPVRHYLEVGYKAGLQPCRLFDEPWYRQQYGIDQNEPGLAHYLREGQFNGLWPNPKFDPVAYTEVHPDAAAKRLSPIEHLLTQRQLSTMPLGPFWTKEDYTVNANFLTHLADTLNQQS